MTSSGPALVEMTGVDKRFGSTRALRGVDLSLSAGRVPGTGRPQRRRKVDHRLDPVRPGRARRRRGAVRRRARRRGSATSPAGASGSPRSSSTRWSCPTCRSRRTCSSASTARFVSWRELRARTREIMRDWGYDIAAEALCRDLTRGAASDRRDRAGTRPRRQVRAARRADRRARARRGPAAVRAGAAAHRRRRRRPVHLPPPRGGLRDLPGRRGAARRRAGADGAGRRAEQGRPGRRDGRQRAQVSGGRGSDRRPASPAAGQPAHRRASRRPDAGPHGRRTSPQTRRAGACPACRCRWATARSSASPAC